MKIVSTPDQVCLEHALEFWTGLLVYATDRSASLAQRANRSAGGSEQDRGHRSAAVR
jgi:hypothetical protein